MPRVFATVLPLDSRDGYAVTDVQFQKGGWREVATIADRDAISQERRSHGMVVFVTTTRESWALLGSNLSNTSWQKIGSNTVIQNYSNPPGGSVTVVHNFGYSPSVTVTDTAGIEGFAEIRHQDSNTTIVLFNKISGSNDYPSGVIILK